MRKIIRITESDIVKIIEKIIRENEEMNEEDESQLPEPPTTQQEFAANYQNKKEDGDDEIQYA